MAQPHRWQKISRNIALVMAGLFLGFIFAAQWNVAPVETDPFQHSREDLASTIQKLEDEQEALKSTISQLRAEMNARQKESSKSMALLEGLTSDLELQRTAAGLYPMKGPGVRIILADSAVSSIAVGANPNDFIIHDYDLRDVVNTLWSTNAEAVAINEERLVSTTSITCVGSTVMVNNTRLAPPFEIRAIGDVESLRRALADPLLLQDLRARAKTVGLQFKVTDRSDITVPAFRGSFSIGYASPSN